MKNKRVRVYFENLITIEGVVIGLPNEDDPTYMVHGFFVAGGYRMGEGERDFVIKNFAVIEILPEEGA